MILNSKKTRKNKKSKFPKVGIVITTYNQEKLLIKFIKSLLEKTDYPNYRVYFIDDSGEGKIGKNISNKFPSLKVHTNNSNLGCSISYNQGMKNAIKDYSPEYFLLLNDDMDISDKKWLKKMVDAGESNKNVGILGCRIIYPNGKLQWIAENNKIISIRNKNLFEVTEKMKKNQEVSNIIGCCFLIKKKVIEKIGMWDEKFSPAYGEETDYCFRASKAGFKLMYVGDTQIIHYGSSSTNKLDSSWIWFLKKRNGIRLEWLNHGILNIIKFTFIHFASAIFNKEPIKKLKLLFKAYKINIKNRREILLKRKERFLMDKNG